LFGASLIRGPGSVPWLFVDAGGAAIEGSEVDPFGERRTQQLGA
jgi:hypothetical protein